MTPWSMGCKMNVWWKWKSLSRVQLFATHGLYSPRNSPGQNTGVGSLSLLQWIFPTQKSNPGLLRCRQILYQLSYQGSGMWQVKVAQSCPILCDLMGHSPQNSPGQNTAVGSLSLLQWIFPTQRSNPGFPHCRWIIYQLSLKESPGILEWVAYPFSSGSSQPRNRTGISCIAGRFFTNYQESPMYVC